MSAGPSWFERFRGELRRRRVYRAAATYAAGVFVVWQAVDLAGSALDWPSSVLTFVVITAVALTPVVLGLSWIYDLRRSTTADPAPPSRSPRLRVSPTLGIGTAAVASGALLGWLLWPQPLKAVGDFRAGDRILLSACENATANPAFGGLLDTALDAAVRQSIHVQTVSHAQARSYAANNLGRTEPPDTLTRELARDVAVRMGLKVVIHCSIRQVDDQYLVSATITEPREAVDLVALSEHSAGTDGLFAAIDRLAAGIRRALGESLRSVADARPLAEVTTPSLGALISFTEAIDAQRRGDYNEAARLFEVALDQDSLFARAHAALGTFDFFFVRDIPRAEEHYRKALQHPERISERDRLWIEAGWASNRDEHQRAITLYRTYLERWPADVTGWYNLGTEHFRLQQCDEAEEAFRKALTLDPTYASAYVNLASCLAGIGRIESALAYYDSVFRLRPDWKRSTGTNHEYGQLLVQAGRVEEAEQLFRGQLDGTPAQQAAGRRSLALLRMFRGRYREARPLLDESARQQRALGNGLSEYRDRLYLAGVLETIGEDAAAGREMARVREIMTATYVSPAWAHYAFNHILARGDVGHAREILARAEADSLASSSIDRASVIAMRAELLLEDGRRDEALAEARLAVATDPFAYLAEALCRIALAVGANDVALDACGRLIAPRIRTGWEAQEPSVLAHFWLARLRESMGEPDAAVTLYAKFLEIWKDGDEELRFRDLDHRSFRPIEDARARLERLMRARS